MPDGLYQSDALAWAGEQAALLRRLASGERVNEAVDWSNVIEELQDVGLCELRSCQSLLLQAMTHLLKLHAWPENSAWKDWRNEASVFLNDAARRSTPSMRQRIGLDELYVEALRRARMVYDELGEPTHSLPGACPFSPDALLTGDVPALVSCLAASV